MAGRRRSRAALVGVALAVLCADAGRADPPSAKSAEQPPIDRICDLIAAHADDQRLPRAFLARLLWKESRFDPNAVSHKGAEGIAQFMPGTAALRGLDDPFDVEKAIPASAAYLADLNDRFGNLGLAAAAYNSGEARVARWLESGGFLPLETENFVLDITGEPADSFADRKPSDDVPPLDEEKSFDAACRAMPVSDFSTVAMATIPVLPWGVQVAGSFDRAAAIRSWRRVRARNEALLGGVEPVVSRVRSPIGRRGVYAVRIGAETRGEANRLCSALRRSGGSCVVTRNR